MKEKCRFTAARYISNNGNQAPRLRGFFGERGIMCQVYRFLPNRRVRRETEGMTEHQSMKHQAEKVLEEAYEVIKAVEDGEGELRILEECADVIQAVEGLQRFFCSSKVRHSFVKCAIKCRNRGDYE